MTDPFDIEDHPPCLMNISTGMHATREVQDSLLSAVNEGEKFLALDQLSSYVNGIYQHHDRGNICGSLVSLLQF